MSVRIINADVLDGLGQLPDESVHCVCTSPPYWGLRDYGTATWTGGSSSCNHISHSIRTGAGMEALGEKYRGGGKKATPEKAIQFRDVCSKCGADRVDHQIGLEPTPEAFVARLVEVFHQVRRVLRNDGTLWINLGDSYATKPNGSIGASTLEGASSSHEAYRRTNGLRSTSVPVGLKHKDLVGIPWLVAFAMRADGWWLRQEIIWCLSGGTRIYARTQKGDTPMTIKDLVRLDPETVKLWNGTKWTQVLGFSETPRPDETFEIELRSGERIGCTSGHLWPTQRGNVRADGLAVGDVIATCQLPEPEAPREPEYLPAADVGWFIGSFLADGSYGDHGSVIQIASHSEKSERFSRLKKIAEAFDGTFALHFHDGKSASVHIYSPVLLGILQAYITGENACGKRLSPRCWRRNNEFLTNVLTSYLDSDGHWDAPNRRYRVGFTQNDALAADLRTLCARLGLQIRLKRCAHESQWGVFPGWRGEIRFSRSAHHNCKDDGEIVAIRGSRARKFWDIGVEDEPHLFALASGVLTHNSKPNPMPESCLDRCTKSHEHLFLLSKSARYHYDADAIREAAEKGYDGSVFNAGKTAEHQLGRSSDKPRAGSTRIKVPGGWDRGEGGHGTIHRDGRTSAEYQEAVVRDGRNKRSVWTIATQAFAEAHFATFPEKLVEPCVLAGCPVGGTVLDPFGGSGTTAIVADKLGRDAILIELNPDYAAMAERRIARDRLERGSGDMADVAKADLPLTPLEALISQAQ